VIEFWRALVEAMELAYFEYVIHTYPKRYDD
jgi:hypothetical protein